MPLTARLGRLAGLAMARDQKRVGPAEQKLWSVAGQVALDLMDHQEETADSDLKLPEEGLPAGPPRVADLEV